VANGLLEPGEPGLGGITINLGLGACPATPIASAQTASDGTYQFTNLAAGSYCLAIDSLAGQNASLLPGSWSSPSGLGGSALAAQDVAVPEGLEVPGIDFGWDYQFLPAPEVTPTVPVVTATPGTAGCVDSAAFVQDVTIPDNTLFPGGQQFEKIWRLRNSGTCPWTTSYSLIFASGDSMSGPAATSLPGSVPPGQTVDLRLALRAPARNGTYRGNWLLRNPSGTAFGLGPNANQPFWVQVVVGPTPTPARNAWRGEYFASRNLSGAPALVRSDSTLDFSWGRNAPASGIPADNFSVRWTRRLTFAEGTYRFRLTSDDGARLWIDGRLVIDQWSDGSAREATIDLGLLAGDYDVRVEYYEHTGDARILLRWDKLTNPSYPEWRGQYWFDAGMSSRISLVRNDRALDFDWGSASPASILPGDNFSARWTRTLDFTPGVYRISAFADDGIRVYLDGQLLIDEWHDSSGSQTYSVQRTLAGTHQFLVAYFEHGGSARVRVSWGPGDNTPTLTSTATVTATITNTPEGATDTPTATASVTQEPPTDTATPTASPEVPTDTPTPTATPEPPTPTEAPGVVVVYNFVEDYCRALWSSGAGALGCPGTEGDASGYVVRLSQATLENGAAAADVLNTHPQNTDGGYIEGVFSPLSFQGGERFVAEIGCLAGHPACTVTFQISYLTEGEVVRPLAFWSETLDGNVTSVEVDLGSLAGQTVPIILRVEANASPAEASAFWLRARIVR
jgi:hypothetical protein